MGACSKETHPHLDSNKTPRYNRLTEAKICTIRERENKFCNRSYFMSFQNVMKNHVPTDKLNDIRLQIR